MIKSFITKETRQNLLRKIQKEDKLESVFSKLDDTSKLLTMLHISHDLADLEPKLQLPDSLKQLLKKW